MDNMTATEIVSSLAHTSIPTIVVEGRDDMSILRLLEDKSGINVLPCGGKDCLLEVFERREQFSGLKCAFLLDRDTWIFSSVPQVEVDPLVEGYGVAVATGLPVAGHAWLYQQPLTLVVVVGRDLSRQCGTRAHDAHPFCQDEKTLKASMCWIIGLTCRFLHCQ